MKTRIPLLALLAGIGFSGCSDNDDSNGGPGTVDLSPYLESFYSGVAIPTYTELRDNADALLAAVQALAADRSNQDLLDAAAEAWIDTRAPWESSEAFLFGPAEIQGLDPSLDSWPVDRQQLNDVLASSLELNAATIAEGLGPALRGFHTAEYLLFRDGMQRMAADLTVRESEYLVAVCQVLADDAALLLEGWTGAYGQEFRQAGSAGSRFLSQKDALYEIVEGMIGIADEVGAGKIADPYDNQDTELVESQFSWNSLTDFQNNIRSIRHAYTGGRNGDLGGMGLNDYVAERDAELNTRTLTEIDAAIAAIAAIPHPFRDNLDQGVAIEAAQAAVGAIATTLESDLKALLDE